MNRKYISVLNGVCHYVRHRFYVLLLILNWWVCINAFFYVIVHYQLCCPTLDTADAKLDKRFNLYRIYCNKKICWAFKTASRVMSSLYDSFQCLQYVYIQNISAGPLFPQTVLTVTATFTSLTHAPGPKAIWRPSPSPTHNNWSFFHAS